MDKITISSAFSLGMLAGLGKRACSIKTLPLDTNDVKQMLREAEQINSGIGHDATRLMLQSLLDLPLPEVDPQNRTKLHLLPGDKLVVCQYIGRRLNEGEIIQIPDIKGFSFVLVTVGE